MHRFNAAGSEPSTSVVSSPFTTVSTKAASSVTCDVT